MSEYGRTRLDETQTEELKEFFADEFERASAALAGSGYAQQGQGAKDASEDAASG